MWSKLFKTLVNISIDVAIGWNTNVSMGFFDGSIAIDSSSTGNIGGIAISQNSTDGGSEAIALEHGG